MLEKNIKLVEAFLERDAQDYSDNPFLVKIAQKRNVEIIEKLKGKRDGNLIINITNLGQTTATLNLRMGKSKNYYRVVDLGSQPQWCKISKAKEVRSGGIKNMTAIK